MVMAIEMKEEIIATNIKLDPKLKRQAKAASAAIGITFKEFVEMAIREALERNKINIEGSNPN